MLCGWGVQAGWLIPWVDKTSGWQVKLCDDLLIRAILGALEVSSHEKPYTNILSSTSSAYNARSVEKSRIGCAGYSSRIERWC